VDQYLLDTNVVSELKKHRPHGAVLAWLNQQQDEHLRFKKNMGMNP
jgi:predicted nucleic acid-binding protein